MHFRFAKRTRFVGVAASIISTLFHSAVALAATAPLGPDSLPRIESSDNRKPAGRRSHKVLTLNIDARMGLWYPEGATGVGLKVAAFAESGKPLANPGPLIRVPQGTQVVVTVRNTLETPLTMHGLGATRGLAGDSVRIAPGATHEFRFHATVPGTYYYAGVTGRAPVLARGQEDSQLNGAIVVDPPHVRPALNDRVFLISWWFTTDATSPTGLDQATMTINGRAWPHTEVLDVATGDSLHWRWINMTIINHPMHLHGFYFRVDGVGNGAQYNTYALADRRQAVTELLPPGGTMSLAWSPNRPGNWIFHCHMAAHMSHLVSIGTRKGVPAAVAQHAHGDERTRTGTGSAAGGSAAGGSVAGGSVAGGSDANNTAHAMAGLVMGIRVAPRGSVTEVAKDHRPLRLTIQSRANVFGPHAGFSYALGNTPNSTDSSVFGMAGPTLVLQQHQPVAITVVNRSHEPAAVHWHGIELESFPDGVPGWSGVGNSLLPAIAPGDSLVVRFTPHRAGTFMYHSHFNEMQQIATGLHGAIVVLAPGEPFEPDTDRVLLFSDDGPTQNLITGPFPATRLNGKVKADVLELRVGVTYRLRLINIRTDYTLVVALMNAELPMEWRPVAKDGADLPATQAVAGPARVSFSPGEIYDFEFTPRTVGEFALQYRMTGQGPADARATSVPVRVR